MVSRGHEVTLYVLRDTAFTQELDDFPCSIVCLNVDSLASLRSWKKLFEFRRDIEKKKYEVLHGFFNDVALLVPPLFLGSKMAVFTSRRDMGIWYTTYKLMYLRLFSSSSVKLICNCKAVANKAERLEYKNSKKINVILNGIDSPPSFFEQRSEFLEELTKTECIKLVVVANVRPVKRIEDLVDALQLITQKGVLAKCFVIGHISDIEYAKKLNERIERHRLTGLVKFVGPISEPRIYLSQFDVGLITSESEGLSNTLMEYLTAGLPAIASNVGGNPELVNHGDNGFLYEKGNVRELANMLEEICKNELLRERMSGNSISISEKFSITRMLDEHEGVYASNSQ
ncbi:glycosyltransferase [Marinobacter sp. R17]|nr:glycosyltransferase [Marinobacter sp. R17]